jgi:hypothetical protein
MLPRLARVALPAAALALGLAMPAAAATDRPAVVLPGDAVAAGLRAESGTWLVGARPGEITARIAALHGARHVGPAGTGGYLVDRGRARALAAALRRAGVLDYAEPNVLRHVSQAAAVGRDPLDNYWRDLVAGPALAPPPVTPQSPLIALVDAALDATHPEFASSNTSTLGGIPVTLTHGTATASVAAAPQQGIGLTGLWPNARALNVPLDHDISCADSANGIAQAIRAGAAVINMSYGSADSCTAETDAVQRAVRAGIVPVAAGGNERAKGNPVEYPASLPHVVTVAAVGPTSAPSSFSNSNAAIDLAAPGEDIPTAVPVALDTQDGTADGFEYQSGTSFAAPMVAAAIAWVRAARPQLTADQATSAVRYSARDVGPRGYDARTGWGVLSVGAALTLRAPLHDPAEPNDDMRWVNGRAFGMPSPPLYRGSGTIRVPATLDAYEDPADVYRVKVRGGRRVRLSAKPAYGDVTLTAYTPAARSLTDRRRRIGRSAHRGKATERLTIRNRSRATRTFFVAVEVAGRNLDAGYVLRARR